MWWSCNLWLFVIGVCCAILIRYALGALRIVLKAYACIFMCGGACIGVDVEFCCMGVFVFRDCCSFYCRRHQLMFWLSGVGDLFPPFALLAHFRGCESFVSPPGCLILRSSFT